MVGTFNPACELLPPWKKELVLLPLYLFSDLPPFPNQMYSVYRQCGCGGGCRGVDLCCRPHSAGVLHHIQNLQNCFTTQTKLTSKDYICKGIGVFKVPSPMPSTMLCTHMCGVYCETRDVPNWAGVLLFHESLQIWCERVYIKNSILTKDTARLELWT
jgi:hypothetical protein